MNELAEAKAAFEAAAWAYNAAALKMWPVGSFAVVTLGRARVCLRITRVGRCMDWRPGLDPVEVYGHNVATGTLRSFQAHDETARFVTEAESFAFTSTRKRRNG